MGEPPHALKSLADLRDAEWNPRIIPDASLEALRHSVHAFGDISGIVWNSRTGRVVCGHQRKKALMQQYGDSLALVVHDDGSCALTTPEREFRIRVVDWDEGTEKAANVAANSPLLAGDFTHHLGEIVKDIEASLPDLVNSLLLDQIDIPPLPEEETSGQTDPDSVPEPPDAALSKRGELYRVGDHRLMCGDAGSAFDVDALLAGAPIHLVNTDPLYNVKVEPRSSTAIAAGLSSFPEQKSQMHHQGFDVARGVVDPQKAKKQMRAKDRPLLGDFVSDEAFAEMLLAWFGNMARVMQAGGTFYIWGGYANLGNYPPALKASGLYFSQGIVWDKQHPVLTRKDFMGAFEICFYGWKQGAGHHFLGPNNATDLWHVKKINPARMIHLTQKPVELARRAIQYSSSPGENVLDLFAGSGTILIACEQTSRQAYLMELDELYCDVIRRRWAEFVHGEGCDWQQLTPARGSVTTLPPETIST